MDTKGNVNFMFTAQPYFSLIDGTLEMIDEAKSSGVSAVTISELYGIYYNLFSGLLRAGTAMYKKEMEEDGYARLVMSYGGKNYTCKDSAIRDILKEEYDTIVHPYEDSSASWVKPYNIDSLEVSMIKKEAEKEAIKGMGGMGAGSGPMGNIQSVDIPVGYDQKPPAVTIEGPDYPDRVPELILELESISGYIKSKVAGMVVAAIIMATALLLL